MATAPARVDREGHNALYAGATTGLEACRSADEYVRAFTGMHLSPFYAGGTTKGYVRGLAVRRLMESVEAAGRVPADVRVLDAGCGQGTLTTYLACRGFQVVSVDVSEVACAATTALAERMGVGERVSVRAESLELLSLPDASADFIVGHAALHHFIKYPGVPAEFERVLKPGGQAFFADAFGENRAYHVFHNREQMERLGDVILTRRLICEYFNRFRVTLVPTDWFVMLDKLYLRLLPRSAEPLVRALSRVHFALDRLIPNTGVTLFLAGAVMTVVEKPASPAAA